MANLPISPAQAELVYSWRTNGKAWVHDVALDDAGNPVIVYATSPPTPTTATATPAGTGPAGPTGSWSGPGDR
jgi:hypothetical protein